MTEYIPNFFAYHALIMLNFLRVLLRVFNSFNILLGGTDVQWKGSQDANP